MPLPILRPCRVVIAGGGISGLTLALILERVGIDYVLLEAYSDIVAEAGTGLTVLPNGLRVLDQLGCMDDLLAWVGNPIDSMSIRNSNGEVLKREDNWHRNCPKRSVLVLLLPVPFSHFPIFPFSFFPFLHYYSETGVLTTTIDTDILSFG